MLKPGLNWGELNVCIVSLPGVAQRLCVPENVQKVYTVITRFEICPWKKYSHQEHEFMLVRCILILLLKYQYVIIKYWSIILYKMAIFLEHFLPLFSVALE